MIFKDKTAVALGSFDGLHKGHMSVIACALSMKECGLVPLALLFDSHPMLALTGQAPPEILQSAERERLLTEMGVKFKYISFKEIMNLTCREFFEEILLKRLNAAAVCCGWNYRFGRGNEGGCRELSELSDEFGVELHISDHVDLGGEPISSSRIRLAVEQGDIPLANAMLGREFSYSAPVVSGYHRGHLLGAPTINQRFEPDFVRPRKGVYASFTTVGGVRHPSVTNIGLRPSFENEDFRSETCIIGFSGDLYGQVIKVSLLDFIRDEQKFGSVEALSAQITLDAARAKEIFEKRGDSGNV